MPQGRLKLSVSGRALEAIQSTDKLALDLEESRACPQKDFEKYML